jgi:hypothetical protein
MSELCANCGHPESRHFAGPPPFCMGELEGTGLCPCESYVPPATPSAAPPQTAAPVAPSLGSANLSIEQKKWAVLAVYPNAYARKHVHEESTRTVTVWTIYRPMPGHEKDCVVLLSDGWPSTEGEAWSIAHAKLPAPDAQGGDESGVCSACGRKRHCEMCCQAARQGDRCYQHGGKPKPIPPLLLQAYRALRDSRNYTPGPSVEEAIAAIEAEYPEAK